jgi:hypothetical protein
MSIGSWKVLMSDEDPAHAEPDMIFTAELIARHDYVNELASTINEGSLAQITAMKITARAELSRDKRAATFKVSIPDEADRDLTRWALRLADFLFNARATLDNVFWLVTHDTPLATPTKEEEKKAYFPIAATDADWSSFAGRSLARKIRPPLLERLRVVQPFLRTDSPTSRGLQLLHKIHIQDKHRQPLALGLHLDTKLPVMLTVGPARPGPFECWQEWLDWKLPLRDGLAIKRVRLDVAIDPPIEPSPILAAPNVEFDGELYDLQDFMWDIQGGVLRVIDQVCIGTTLRADLWDASIAWRRESEAALTRSLLDGTNEWEDRGFNKHSPYDRIYDELAKPDPNWALLTGDPDFA